MLKRLLPSVLICSSVISGTAGIMATGSFDVSAVPGSSDSGANRIDMELADWEIVEYQDGNGYGSDDNVLRISVDGLNRTSSDSGTRNFYDILKADEKIAYDMMKAALEKSITTETVEMVGVTNPDSVKRAYCAFVSDHPEYFWLHNVDFSFFETQDSLRNISITFKCCVGQSFAELEQNYKLVNDKVNKIVRTANESYSTDYEKMKYFAGYLCDNVKYNKGAASGNAANPTYANCWNAYGALINGSGVCEAYAEAFKLLCDAAGIPCISVYSRTHEWNAVKLDDKWYYVDVSWIDTDNKKSAYKYDSWFAVGTKTADICDIGTDHDISHAAILNGASSKYTYPAISSSDYVFVRTDYITGDLNGDGIVNNKDLVLLRYYFYNNNITLPAELNTAADLNGNGIFDEGDVTFLRELLTS